MLGCYNSGGMEVSELKATEETLVVLWKAVCLVLAFSAQGIAQRCGLFLHFSQCAHFLSESHLQT